MGTGAAKRVSAVRWGVAGNIVAAWVLTLPASAAVGGLTYAVVALLGTEVVGPVVVAGALLVGARGRGRAPRRRRADADGGGLTRGLRRRHASPVAGDLGLVRRRARDRRAVLARDPGQRARRRLAPGGAGGAAAGWLALAVLAFVLFAAASRSACRR